ncbi:MAG: tetratricopeptide repeat protein [Syntrophobacteraceae bacterium]
MNAKKMKVAKKKGDGGALSLTLAERYEEFVDKYAYHVVGVIVAILLVGVGFYSYRSHADSKEAQAGTEYSVVIAKWPADEAGSDPKKWEETISELAKFAEKYDGTQAGMSAGLDLSKAFFRAGKYDDAFKAANKVLSGAPSGHSLKAFARYQVALSADALGKGDEALAQWDALKKESALGNTREADWHVARIYEKKQDYARAADAYERAMKAAGDFPETGIIRQELESARAKAGGDKAAPQKGNS